MTTTEIEERVIEIVAEELNLDVSEVDSQTSINHSDTLVMKFEEEFDIIIPGEQQGFDTVNDAVVCIDGIMNGANSDN